MKIAQTALLDELTSITKANIKILQGLKLLPLSQLHYRPSETSWSALECIEHLNRYSQFYVKEINDKINKSSAKPSTLFNSGWLGNYFANAMKPAAAKMNTFKSMNTLGCSLSPDVIDDLLHYQKETLEILQKCKTANLNKIRTGITISPLIKLKLGDTLRVVIYHNQRHLQQAQRAIDLSSR